MSPACALRRRLAVLSLMSAFAFALAVPASAVVVVDRTFTDATFTAACGGADTFGCEYAVVEGRAGNRAPNGNGERQIFDRITNGTVSGQAAAGTSFAASNPFSIAYDGVGALSLSYLGAITTLSGRDLGLPVAGDNPAGVAGALVLRVREASLSGLAFNGAQIDDGILVAQNGSNAVSYLGVFGLDLLSSWVLTGDATLGGLNNSGSAFQVKVTDLALAAVPLPAPAALMLAGLAALAAAARRRRA